MISPSLMLRVLSLLFLSLFLHAQNPPDLEKLISQMGQFEHLPEILRKWQERGHWPREVRVSLRGALQKEDLELHPFNLDFKEEFGFPRSLGGFVVFPKDKIKFFTPLQLGINTSDLGIQMGLDRVKEKHQDEWFLKDYTLFLPDEPIRGAAYNPLLVTVHELAHVDFHRRVLRLRRDSTGTISRELFTYINERYAHEIEFLLLKSIQRDPDLLFRTPDKWISRAGLVPGAFARKSIARYVREAYHLRDERLARLDALPIDELMSLLKD